MPSRTWLLASIIFGAFSFGIADAEPMAIGSVDRVQEPVEATQAGKTRSLSAASDIYFRDQCRSGEDARLQATLKDGTKLTMGARATLSIDDFVYDPAKSRAELSIRIAKGSFLYVGGLIEGAPGAKVRLQTSAASIGVRGTTVWAGPIDKGFGVLALSGEVTVTAKGRTVTLKRGEGTMIFANGGPRPVVVWPESKVGRALASVTFGRLPDVP
jgi:hypothetical protein